MFYVIKKGQKYFKSNGYVNSSGCCDTATWVATSGQAYGTSSKEKAVQIARVHGGKAVPYR